MQGAEDLVLSYARARGWRVQRNNVLLEGTTDEALFRLARNREKARSGVDLFDDGVRFIAAGKGDRGGTTGVLRELTTLRSLSECVLDRNGRPRYRFVGLVDNDMAGRRSVKGARSFDPNIREYRDLFRIRPVMPTTGNLDLKTLERSCERLNANFRGLDWELEDLLPEQLMDAFVKTAPSVVRKRVHVCGKVHWELAPEGKGRLHKYVRMRATWCDLGGVLGVIRAMRFVLKLPAR